MPKHSKDGKESNGYQEYGPPASTLKIKEIGDENQIWLDEPVSGTVVLRLLKQMLTEMEFDEGEIDTDGGPRIEFEDFSVAMSIDLFFHEQNMEKEFRFKSNYHDGIPNPPEVTPPSELGGKVEEYAKALEDKFDVMFDFAELEGASMGREHIVDFEFKYEGAAVKSDIVNAEL